MLLILIIFMLFIMFGFSDVNAENSAKDRDRLIPVVISLESERALEIGVKPCKSTPLNLKDSNSNSSLRSITLSVV